MIFCPNDRIYWSRYLQTSRQVDSNLRLEIADPNVGFIVADRGYGI